MNTRQPYYQDEYVTLYRGDALDVMATLEGFSADALITDPPYCAGGISEASRVSAPSRPTTRTSRTPITTAPDISAADPRRYPSTDILITSPECTTHSPAGGNRHRKASQRDLFVPTENDPETVRSRATMWDVVRFTEYHEYRAVIVENVVEVVRNWVLFPVWWQAMENLGYIGQIRACRRWPRYQRLLLPGMFAVPEVQATMAFHRGYIIKGTKGKQIKQLGNAVTPPAMELLIQRVVQFLNGTRSLPVRAA